MDDLIHAVRKFNPNISRFDTSVFDGKYITSGVSEEYLAQLELQRNDSAKLKDQIDSAETIGLHNSFSQK